MASPKRHRRGSMEEPITMSSDVIHLCEELKRLNKDFSPECNKHMEAISTLLSGIKEVYISAVSNYFAGTRVGGLGLAFLFVGLGLFLLDEEFFSLIIAGAGAGLAVAGGFRVAFGQYKKRQQQRIKRNIEEELQGLQDQHSPIIDILEEICRRTEEILRDASPSDHKAQAWSKHFSSCFEERHFFQENDTIGGDWMSKSVLLSRNLSEMIAKVSSVSEILNEILKDDKRTRDKPAKLTRQQKQFKENAEKLIDEMQREIRKVKNGVEKINQLAEKISNDMTFDFF